MLKRISRSSFAPALADSQFSAGPLLLSKLAPPPWRGELIDRPQLIELLDRSEPQQVVLLAAPTGFGKTTLLNAWARRTARAVGWITLDQGDNDPARFGAYFIAAIDRLYPGIGAPLLAMVQSSQPAPMEWSVIALLNAIAARPEPITLVLDDCHTISMPEIYQGLAFLADHMPANLTLILASRGNPPLPLARWRARRQLAELRADMLRFTGAEAAQLFAAMRLELHERDIAQLMTHTEGWAAGLYLAARSIAGQPNRAGFFQSLNGGNRYIADYLIDEVLSRQPDDVQQFLLQTSILSRLSGPLCDAVMSQPGSQAMLERLENDNLLAPLDADRRWFRYHQLFAESFRTRLDRLQPQSLPLLHRRAAEWHIEHESLNDAVEHMLAAGDSERAAWLIDAQAEALIERGEMATLRGWLAALAMPVLRQHARLCLWYAWAELAAFQFEAADQWLRAAAQAADTAAQPDRAADAQAIAIEIEAVRAIMIAIRGDVPRGMAIAGDLLARLAPDQPRLRQTLGILIAFGSLFSGDGSPPPGLIHRGELAALPGDPAAELRRLHYYATLYRVRGQLQAAKAVYQRQLAVVGALDKAPVFGGMLAQVGLSAILCEQYELTEAQRLADACLDFGRGVDSPPLIVDAMLIRSHLQEADGDSAGALETLRRIEQYLRNTPLQAHAIWLISVHQVRLWLKLGDQAAAIAWAYAYERGDFSSSAALQNVQRYSCDIALARVQILQGRFGAAQRLIDRVRQSAEQHERLRLLIKALIAQAELWQAQGNRAEATQTIAQALTLAEADGFVQIFVREGGPMRVLLLQLRQSLQLRRSSALGSRATGYLDRLLKLLGADAPNLDGSPVPAFLSARPEDLPEQLSAREYEVLRMLAEGRSNQDLARDLVVSIATIKTHLIHIYRKLGARNRTEAIAQARALNLI